jgi:peptidoglycan/LPS O-acetylase OafA/YrhL
VGGNWRHIVGLDGLRGVAIAFVLAGHAAALPGGGLGVDLFFAVSGFLITSLLVEEWSTTARLDRPAFYRRRAARLLPALMVMMAPFTLLLLATGRPGVLVQAAIGAAYVSNLVQAVTPQPKLFSHLWSLAEEEQFYLLWPFVLGWLLSRRVRPALIVVSLALAAALSIIDRTGSAIGGASLHRLWFAPDSHADAIILGCLVGIGYSYGLWRMPAIAGYGATLVVGAVAAAFSLDGRALYEGPMAAFAIAAAILVAAIADNPGSLIARALNWRPLRGLGRMSYGVYLWHLPLFLIAGPVIGTVLTVAVASASYRYIEQPALRRWRLRAKPVPASPVLAPAS